ncbi:hypothetical protein FPRO06_05919 [Fusarium proliferatum]|uniref:receptor protein-tyrosine kinase n=2 Tax=Gibberella intermedia TaxID=948311 RepID=A0A365MNH3_GIBIN|nr:uncharacterized protein FPRO_08438 [Fusarium proliferatum ET1]KAG4263384.1 hypothetical protein FPRO03_09691 [Fusarium proliferatum]KAI1060816.1 hypothetical protein LB506_007302 [Fusarium annulatum]KAG4280795.1 hypothetical protein FPRO04_05509 [Fusarium proliferatum]KAG4288267.1 hypothetical protein FPRO06_05919 [Fusarium proliferatum]RBA09968.1 hypothetical protein FPRO05_05904 [Fusarium proliferatum]
MGSSMRWLAVAALVSFSLDKTSALEFDLPPSAPEPTSPARLRAIRHVYARADATTETLSITVAPDNTCGFYTPNTSFFFTCTGGVRCMYENDKYNVAFCGERDFKTACMNSADALNPDKCDVDCRRNTNIQKCTADTKTECYTIYFPNNIEKYPCHTQSGFSSMNFPDGVSDFEQSTLGVDVFPALATTEASSTEESTTEVSSKSTTAASTTTVTGAPQNDDGEENKDNSGSSTPVGAIAGGVVGGVAILVAVGLIIFFIRRRDNKKKAAAQPLMSDQAHTQPQMPYGMAPQQQHMHPYQEWHTGSPPPQGWQQSPSPPILGGAPVLVEAPDSNTAQIHEMGDGTVKYK